MLPALYEAMYSGFMYKRLGLSVFESNNKTTLHICELWLIMTLYRV